MDLKALTKVPLFGPVGKQLNVIILRSRPSFSHSLSIILMICIVIMSWRRSSPALNMAYTGPAFSLTFLNTSFKGTALDR